MLSTHPGHGVGKIVEYDGPVCCPGVLVFQSGQGLLHPEDGVVEVIALIGMSAQLKTLFSCVGTEWWGYRQL